jgi:hypothetical protein
MKSLNTKLVLSVLGIVAMLTGPAFAKKPHPSQQQHVISDPAPQTRGIYNMVPNPYGPTNPYDPAATGGGSFGYNQSVEENKW